jgi:ketosteroid isomerase-like protein
MSTTPDIITRYFDASERGAAEEMVACFTDDAWVIDEGNRYDGKEAIRRWRAKSASSYTYTLQVLGVTHVTEDTYSADTHLEGDFPGGVADLEHVFTLRGQLIASLTI